MPPYSPLNEETIVEFIRGISNALIQSGHIFLWVDKFHLQAALIEAVTHPGDVVLDPAAGSYSTLRSVLKAGRQFLGCDISEVAIDWSKSEYQWSEKLPKRFLEANRGLPLCRINLDHQANPVISAHRAETAATVTRRARMSSHQGHRVL